jgi:hypothetical protein
MMSVVLLSHGHARRGKRESEGNPYNETDHANYLLVKNLPLHPIKSESQCNLRDR